MADVEFRNAKKVYDGGVTALSEFNLTVKDREFLVLVGPSGCGKSTALRMIAGLEDITSGDLIIDGKRMNDIQPKDRDIAMVFQNYALYPHMSVYDNMAFGLKLRKFDKQEIDKRVRENAEILGLTDYLHRKPKALSGGQRQRVALGRAIARKPKVFLFDEPLSNLDAKMRVQMRKEICQLHKRLESTIIYVTHDQVEAMTMGDRIVVMSDGLIQQVGKPMAIYEKPANKFVAGFIGSPPMNFFECAVRDDGIALNGKNITFSGEKLKALKSASRGKVVMGVRPEDFSLTASGNAVALQGTVDINEPLGSEILVYLSMGPSTSFIAKTLNGVPFKIGESLVFYAPMDKVYCFDGESGTALWS
jgi:multiple sugar transport system ATP-binding protein